MTTLYNVANGVHRPCDIDDELLRTKRSWVTSHGSSWVLTWDPATLATFLWKPHAAAGEITNVALPSIRSIGDRAILVGGSDEFGGWCRASRHGLLPNTIYWMDWDCRLRVYELGKRTEEIRDPCKGIDVDRASYQAFWIIPRTTQSHR
uniref:Uncharacterized protein n=1 Tax=Oryza punctata TaxID=4537 RepID=A0A0E0L7G3_ORYPU